MDTVTKKEGNSMTYFIDASTFICSCPFVFVETNSIGAGLEGRWRLHVGHVLYISQVSQHILQLGPIRPYSTSAAVLPNRHIVMDNRGREII